MVVAPSEGRELVQTVVGRLCCSENCDARTFALNAQLA